MRSALPAEQTIPQVRRVVASIDHDLPAENLRTLDDRIKLNIQSDRLVMQLAAAFAILATVLAMLGLYGVMAHSVTRRTREITELPAIHLDRFCGWLSNAVQADHPAKPPPLFANRGAGEGELL